MDTSNDNGEDETIAYYTLEDLLPAGQTFAFNRDLGTLSLLANDLPLPRLLAEQQFPVLEAYLLVPLLEMFPSYCSYEVMYASFYYNGMTTEAAIERACIVLERAMAEGEWDYALRPIRNRLSTVRAKLRVFTLDIKSIDETGYILMLRSSYKKSQ